MHEYDVTQELIRMIESESKDQIPKKVRIELGALTTYKAGPIRFYFQQLTKDSPKLNNTELIIDEQDALMRCNACNQVNSIEEKFYIVCPACDSQETTIIQGKDFKLKEIVF